MPGYYFHFHDDVLTEDFEGAEVASLIDVRAIALESALDMVCASIRQYRGVNLDHYIRVTDQAGQEVLVITFREAFTIDG